MADVSASGKLIGDAIDYNGKLVVRAWKQMNAAEPNYALYRTAYKGELEEEFTIKAFEKQFQAAKGKFGPNYCAPVVNHRWHALEIENFEVIDESDAEVDRKQKVFRDIWESRTVEGDAVVSDVHKQSSMDGDAATLIWQDSDGNVTLDFLSGSDMRVFYRAGGGKRVAFRANRWPVEDGRYRMDLYFFDNVAPEDRRIEKYIQVEADDELAKTYPGKWGNDVDNWTRYMDPADDAEQEDSDILLTDALGRPLLDDDGYEQYEQQDVLDATGEVVRIWPLPIPFEHDPIEDFAANRDPLTGYGQSDLHNAIKPQNGLNKLSVTRHVAHELATLPPRMAIEEAATGVDSQNAWASERTDDPLRGVFEEDGPADAPAARDGEKRRTAQERADYLKSIKELSAGDILSVGGIKTLVELTTADPAGIIASEKDEIEHLAIGCDMSLTLLIAGAAGANISGEAYRRSNELSIFAVNARKRDFGKKWERVASALMEAAGETETRFRVHFKEGLLDVSEKYDFVPVLQSLHVPDDVILTMLGMPTEDIQKWMAQHEAKLAQQAEQNVQPDLSANLADGSEEAALANSMKPVATAA